MKARARAVDAGEVLLEVVGNPTRLTAAEALELVDELRGAVDVAGGRADVCTRRDDNRADDVEPSRLPGRPGPAPKLADPERRARFLESLRQLPHLTAACAAAGITPSSLKRFRRRARRQDAPEDWRRFLRAERRARLEGEVRCVQSIADHGARDWRALKWLLEISNPEEYGQRRSVEHRGQVDSVHRLFLDLPDTEPPARPRAADNGSAQPPAGGSS